MPAAPSAPPLVLLRRGAPPPRHPSQLTAQRLLGESRCRPRRRRREDLLGQRVLQRQRAHSDRERLARFESEACPQVRARPSISAATTGALSSGHDGFRAGSATATGAPQFHDNVCHSGRNSPCRRIGEFPNSMRLFLSEQPARKNPSTPSDNIDARPTPTSRRDRESGVILRPAVSDEPSYPPEVHRSRGPQPDLPRSSCRTPR